MSLPKPSVGGSTPPVEKVAQATPTGQVPGGDPPLERLFFVSLSSSWMQTPRDWGAIEGEQRRLAALGFGLAIGMEADERRALGQRAMAELVRRTGALALPQGFVAGASSEPATSASSLADHIDCTVAQANLIEEAGGVPALLPLALLSRRRAKEEEYVEVYRSLITRIGGPLLIDWTGETQRPELLDYFPGQSFERVMAIDSTKVRGVRLALLDVAREARIRRELLTRDQMLFTSDAEHLEHLLLGAHLGNAVSSIPRPARYTDLAGRSVALGDFSHALLTLSSDRVEAMATALGHIAARNLSGYKESLGLE